MPDLLVEIAAVPFAIADLESLTIVYVIAIAPELIVAAMVVPIKTTHVRVFVMKDILVLIVKLLILMLFVGSYRATRRVVPDARILADVHAIPDLLGAIARVESKHATTVHWIQNHAAVYANRGGAELNAIFRTLTFYATL